MTEKTDTPPQLDLTGAALVVLVCALLSIAVIGEIEVSLVTPTRYLGANSGAEGRQAIIWHLIVVALMVTGFRRLGDVAAVVAAGLVGFIATATLALTGLAAYGTVAMLQLVAAIAAVIDLWTSRNTPIAEVSIRRRVVGLTVSIAIGAVVLAILEHAQATEVQRRERLSARQRDAELGYSASQEILTHSTTNDPSLWSLRALARCIELFRGDSVAGPYPKSLHELQLWSFMTGRSHGCASALSWDGPDTTFAHLDKSDIRVVRYTPPSGPPDPVLAGGFTLEIEAVWDSTTPPSASPESRRNYLIDSSGRVHATSKHRRATSRDTILPNCSSDAGRKAKECFQPFLPSDRWGVTEPLRRHFDLQDTVRMKRRVP